MACMRSIWPPSPLPALPYGPGWLVSEEGQTHLITLWRPGPQGDSGGSGDIHAPMPGLVVAVAVRAGDRVAKGQALLTLEAMKMEQALVAPFAGVVADMNVTIGQQVAADALLARIEEET
jgi:3-methylcrotonyl-CoA carboxylase alpha subunit